MSSTTNKQDALITRTVDFWMIGGLSILVWAVMSIFSPLQSLWAIKHHFVNVAVVASTLTLFVNYPHFMASYKIAYGRGEKFIRKHWFQLIFVPYFMVAILAWAYFVYDKPAIWPAALNPTKLTAGKGLIVLLVNVMYLTVGWHYAKQAFGCMMVYGKFDNYKLTGVQRKLLLAVLYSIWIGNLIGAQSGDSGVSDYYGLDVVSVGFPIMTRYILDAGFWILFGIFAFQVLFQNWRRNRKLPSLNYLTPLLSLMIWWVPALAQKDFYLFLAPLFHSMQYLPFAWRYEESKRATKAGRVRWGGSLFVIGIIVTGYLSFELLPNVFDTYFAPASAGESSMMFLAAANVFINIHHYFIDNVIWRFEQPEVQRYLFSYGTPAPQSVALVPPELIADQALSQA